MITKIKRKKNLQTIDKIIINYLHLSCIKSLESEVLVNREKTKKIEKEFHRN